METIYFAGTECHTGGMVPAAGSKAPNFELVTPALEAVTPETFHGKQIVLNIFPSIDTDVCATSVRKFNEKASGLDDVVVLGVSMDLPFAAGRFCTLNDIKNVTPASAFRDPSFARNYGVEIVDGPLKGLLARAVIIIDREGNIKYRELVNEITHEPDYETALKMLKQ